MELNYFAAIEAVLFASGTPVEINRLAEGLGLAPAAMREQLLANGEQLDRDQRGIRSRQRVHRIIFGRFENEVEHVAFGNRGIQK